MTLQESLLHDQTMLMIGGIGLALFGIGVILWGVWVMRRRTVPSSLRTAWRQHLTLALGDLASEHIDEDVIQSAQQQWLYSHGLLKAGMGAGLVLGVAGWFVLLQAMLRVPFGLPPVGPLLLLLLSLYVGVASGAALVGTPGFRGYRRVWRDGALTSGEPSRRVSDYRSPLLVLIVAVPFLVWSIVTLIVALRYAAFTPDVVREYGVVPPPGWILAVYPGALLLMVIVAEVCVWIVAKSPAPIRLRDAALARRFNMGIIRERMSSIYGLALVWSPQLMMGDLLLFTSLVHADESSIWWTWAWLLLFVFSFVVGLSILFTLGRMGGRLTGWPWGDEMGRENGAAAARGGGAV